MKLVIVESPSKIKTIQKYLGAEYKVMASVGHICDLPKHSLGIDINNDYKPQYVVQDPKKNKIISDLKSAAKKSKDVFLATDPDREGEAISWHIANALDLGDGKNRIEFNEITYKAVHKAISNPRPINMNLVDAQQARRIIDRLVGYKVSPILSSKIKSGLSGGRVQSSALKMLVDREREINVFVPQEYWTITATFTMDNKHSFKSTLQEKNSKKIKVVSSDEASNVVNDLDDASWLIEDIKRTKSNVKPPPPFTTSTMQQDASIKLGYSAPKVMQLAQNLYEGVNIPGEGQIALVTYIRTDSVRISLEMQKAASEFISQNFGKEYVPAKYNQYRSKSKNAQDAHEAIRPVSLEITPESVKDKIPRDRYRLYKLIYDRFLASQMVDMIYDVVNINILANCRSSNTYGFKTAGRTIFQKGFSIAYQSYKNSEEDVEFLALSSINVGMKLRSPELSSEQKFTKPPSRYSEALLIKAMEENGIGRPSTYASIIQVLLKRAYVEKEKKLLIPTILGIKVTEYMEQFFPYIVDLKFTANMEDSLDLVENGAKWQKIIGDFYPTFAKDVEIALKNSTKLKLPQEVSNVVCENCGVNMIVKDGRYGKFLGCPNYPRCKNVKNIDEIVGKCPSCKGDIVKKISKSRKTFYGCKNYPKCSFMSWDLPAPIFCPKCDSIMKQAIDGDNIQYICTNRKCKHVIEVKNEN